MLLILLQVIGIGMPTTAYNVLVLFVCVRVRLPVLGVFMCLIDMGSLYFYRMSVMILRY